MTSEKNVSEITLSDGAVSIDVNKDTIQQLGALQYSPKEIAMYLEVSDDFIQKIVNEQDSLLDYYLKRGLLISQFDEQRELLTSAQGGNVTASERLEKIRYQKGFNISKEDIFGSIRNEVKFSKLQDYLISGASIDISNNEALYLDALRLIDGMERHYGRRNTMKVLQNKPFNLRYDKAREMMEEATNLFYGDRSIDRKALRNKRAEMLMEMAIFAKNTAKTTRDMEVAGNLIMQASKLQELDKQEPPVLPKEEYRKPAWIFTLQSKDVGFFDIDRNVVLNQIDKQLTLPERDKLKLRREAMIEDVIPITEMLEEVTKDK